MQISSGKVSPRAFQSSRPARVMTVQASSRPEGHYAGRREALLAGGALLLGAQLTLPDMAKAERLRTVEIPVKSLSSFQKSDLLEDYRLKAERTIAEMLSKDDAADAVRLIVRQAATYDAASGTGGFNGSIILNSAETDRPENARLKPYIAKLKKVKDAVDAVVVPLGAAPISYSDLMVLAAKVTNRQKWDAIKIATGREEIAAKFRNPWPVTLGRIDSDVAADFHLPADDAPVAEIRAALAAVGAKGGDSGPLAPKPALWEKPGYILWCAGATDEDAEEARFAASDNVFADIKKKYDTSRESTTRTNYEVDFCTFVSRVSSLGAKFDATRYLHPITMQSI